MYAWIERHALKGITGVWHSQDCFSVAVPVNPPEISVRGACFRHSIRCDKELDVLCKRLILREQHR